MSGPLPRERGGYYRTGQESRSTQARDRLEWFLQEYGRPPTRDELIAVREARRAHGPGAHNE